MNLKQFAKLAGLEITENNPAYHGRKYAYITRGTPVTKVCGFKTKSAAREHWLKDTFGGKLAKAIKDLLMSSS